MASLPHISVSGACATGTHGSGINNGNLPTAVSRIEFINSGGELISLSSNHKNFNGIIVGLGGFGIVTKLTLNIEKTYNVRQKVFQFLPRESLEKNDPPIYVGVGGVSDEINIVVVNLKDGEETIIVNKLNELLD